MPYSSPQQVREEIEELAPLYQHLAGSDFEREDLDRADLASSRSEVRRFSSVGYIPSEAVSGDGYPLTLLSGSILPHFGGGTRSSRASRLKKFSPHAWSEIGRADAERLGLSEGNTVKVTSPFGEVTTTIRITETLPQGMIFMPISFAESPVNELFGMELDPRAKTPSLKKCVVRLERINADGRGDDS